MTAHSRAFAILAITSVTAGGAEDPAASLLHAPVPIGAAVAARFGKDVRVLRISIRPDGADIEVQDRKVPLHVDRYAFEGGALGSPEPVQVGRSQKRLDAQLFAFADVDFTILPGLLKDAEERARTEDARASHVSIERFEVGDDVVSWSRPLIRVVVNGPRGGAVVDYQLDGKRKGITRW
jgi:hypothetical protein